MYTTSILDFNEVVLFECIFQPIGSRWSSGYRRSWHRFELRALCLTYKCRTCGDVTTYKITANDNIVNYDNWFVLELSCYIFCLGNLWIKQCLAHNRHSALFPSCGVLEVSQSIYNVNNFFQSCFFSLSFLFHFSKKVISCIHSLQ